MRRRKKKQHKEAIVFQNRIYSHGTATNEIKLKYFLVEKTKQGTKKTYLEFDLSKKYSIKYQKNKQTIFLSKLLIFPW
jgi:hypothetical protein